MQAHVYLEGKLDEPELLSIAGGTAVVYTRPSPRRRGDPNQDALGVFELGPQTGVLAVADGLGGCAYGERAARVALETLAEELERTPLDHTLDDPVRRAIVEANARLLESQPGPATTVVVATVHAGVLRAYTVGDSELLVCGQRGKLKLRTVAHSPVGYAFDSGELDETSALLHHERHYLSNVVGMANMHISATPGLQLAARDTVVLASDGLFDNLYQAEIIDLVRAGEPLAKAERLVLETNQRMLAVSPGPEIPSKPDDLSFILFRRQPPKGAVAAPAN